MKTFTKNTFLVSVVGLTTVLFGDVPRSDIPAPNQRTLILNRGTALLERRKPLSDTIGPGVKNPFNPLEADPVAPQPVKSRLPGSPKELITLLAAQIVPTGSAEREGERFLLFGQRKVKVGETIPISFENTQFELEVVSIAASAFTVRLNNEEFTRPIKPAKTP